MTKGAYYFLSIKTSSARKLENMAMDKVQVVMAKRKPNWSESELLALSDAVDLTFQSSAVNLSQG